MLEALVDGLAPAELEVVAAVLFDAVEVVEEDLRDAVAIAASEITETVSEPKSVTKTSPWPES